MCLCVCVCGLYSASTANMAKIEEMERMLREAHAEKNRLLEHRVHPILPKLSFLWICMLIKQIPICRCMKTERVFSFCSAGAGDGVAQTGSWRREEKEGGLGEEAAGRDKPPTKTSGERGESPGKRHRDKSNRGRFILQHLMQFKTPIMDALI